MINLKRFDPTDSNAASKAAERANELEGALSDILDCLKASSSLSGASAYKGMGINIMQEKAGKLPAAIRWAEKVIAAEK